MPSRYNKEKTYQRFLNKINKTETCWEWLAAKLPKGYGHFYDGFKTKKAHRYSYEYHVGQIPIDMHVCHTCDNPSCVNPEHLFIGTNLDNRMDSMKKDRIAKGASHWNFQSGVYTTK